MKFLFLAMLCLGVGLVQAQTPRALFYLVDTEKSLRSFRNHADKIDIIVPTWYIVDAQGLVSGSPNPEVMAIAKQHGMAVMPIVAASNGKDFEKLLGNKSARQAMIVSLIAASKANGYLGIQFDYEGIDWTYRDTFSAMAHEAALAFHEAGLKLTIAIVPAAPGYPADDGFDRFNYARYRGVYDLQSLGRDLDLLCIMTYDQHSRWTPPGPVGGWQWTLDNITYAAKAVPAAKLSLGIPLYGYHWYAGKPTEDGHANATADYIDGDDARALIARYGGSVKWDDVDHTAYAWFYRYQMREWVYFSDTKTFKDRYDLIQAYGWEGFSSWVLGAEDPAVWNALPIATAHTL